ncbi:MAG TPA: recombination mediator RecR [Bacteroidales bacterium]|jgi:recombination protein RecR|nr:recombination mediator RecR [Bacteroidales bacterium]
MEGNYSSVLLKNVVGELSRLPGIGQKTALRLALHLLKQKPEIAAALGDSILKLRSEIRYCRVCNNISDHEVCDICSNAKRDHTTLCIVEDIRDMMAIENTGQYKGVYHILGGIISPVEGIGPSDLSIDPVIDKAGSGAFKEIIMALPATVEGDTTNFYLFKVLKQFDVNISIIARGIPVGDELDYTDEITLGRSILMRQPYQGFKG